VLSLQRIIPGVVIEVVKEIVPPIPNPTGVVALIGTSDKGPVLEPIRVSSWREFVGIFGSNPNFSLPKEAKYAFLNGVFEVVGIRVVGTGGKKASVKVPDQAGKDALVFEALSPGSAGNNIEVTIGKGTRENTVMVSITDGSFYEVYDNLDMTPDSENYIVNVINTRSKLVRVKPLKTKTEPPSNLPALNVYKLSGGEDPGEPTKKEYEKALEVLESEPDVDIVMACDVSDPAIHSLVEAHCMNMSKEAMGRIGIGTVAPGESVKDIVKRTQVLKSDRFVLVAPYGVAGAVAGLISRLNYYESPTFKPLSGVYHLEKRYTPSELRTLLKAGVLPVAVQRGRGIVVVKGIATSGEQISVTRIVDYTVRNVNNIAYQFIGTLNNAAGRSALKEKITEFLIRMEREGSIVPSTDGTQPAYMVDVYSSELDFAQGIVRVDMAIRPVRAIDYVYVTILVRV